jgi:hypothetical protein
MAQSSSLGDYRSFLKVTSFHSFGVQRVVVSEIRMFQQWAVFRDSNRTPDPATVAVSARLTIASSPPEAR